MQFSVYDIECINQAKTIIDKDISIHHHIPDLALKAGIGTTKLKAGFKAIHQMGMYEYLREQRMQKAMELLMENNKTIKQITKVTGFKHTNNFTKAFKKRFGISPGSINKNKLPGN